jgi:rhomboid protease GluP
MDWSLVLVSQGIETTIDPPQDENGWGLLVAAQDYQKAVDAIRQYRIENRGWPWQRQIFRPGILFDWGSLAWVVLLLLFFELDDRLGFRSIGLVDTVAVAHGQWWRLFTGIWLHADVAHLAANATFGLVLLGLAMARFGTGAGLLSAYLAGAGGNLFVCLLLPERGRSLGASGMVMGALGLLAVQSLSIWRKTRHPAKYIVTGISGGLMLFVLFGLSPDSDVLAHLGGFLSGLLLGGLLASFPALARNNSANLGSGLLFAILVILPWWRAWH